MRAYFHRAAVVGLPANILVLPLAGIMLNSGIAAIALSYVSRPFALGAAWIASGALHWTLRCLGWPARFPLTPGPLAEPTWTASLVPSPGTRRTFVAWR